MVKIPINKFQVSGIKTSMKGLDKELKKKKPDGLKVIHIAQDIIHEVDPYI